VEVPQQRNCAEVVADDELVKVAVRAFGHYVIDDAVLGGGDLQEAGMVAAVVAADQTTYVTLRTVDVVELVWVEPSGLLAGWATTYPAWMMVVEDDARFGV
jgi:hypothetical protein